MLKPDDRYPAVYEAWLVVVATLFLMIILEAVLGPWQSKLKLLAVEGMIVAPVLAFALYRKLDLKAVFRWRPVSLGVLAGALLIGLGMSVLLDELDRTIQMLVPMHPEVYSAIQELMRAQSTFDLVVLILTVSVVAGFAEELLFRGFFQTALENRMEITRAVMMTALVFAMIHFNPWWMAEIVIIGVMLGVVAWKTGSVFPCVVAHAANNLSALYLANAPGAENWYLMGRHVSPWILFSGAIAVVFGFIMTYRLSETKKKIEFFLD